MRRYRRKSTKKNKRRLRRKRTRKRRGGQEPTIVQKISRGKRLKEDIEECKKKLLVMKKKVNQFRAETAAVIEQGDQLAKDITQILAITEKHYKKDNRVSELVKELYENKLY